MKKNFIINRLFLCLFLFMAAHLFPQEQDPLKTEIIVTASHIPSEFTKTARKITVLDQEDLADIPAQSIADLLKYGIGVDLQPRAPFGIQGDLNIRGSTFSQVLVLINGIKVYDPQTAHHNLDIPLPLSQIDRIEILHGQGSSLYGENAFGGVINIVTKSLQKKKIHAELLAGQHNTVMGNLTWKFPLLGLTNSASMEYMDSDGFIQNRDFNALTFSGHSHLSGPAGTTDLTLGFSTREFGADNFYAPFPSREWTDTSFIGLNHQGEKTTARAYFRSHFDRFILDINRPEFYTNEHKNRSYGAEISALLSLSSIGDVVAGGEYRVDEIRSSGLGDHTTHKLGIFTEWSTVISKRWSLNAGLRGDYFSSFGLRAAPHLSLAYLASRIKLRAAAGWSYRIPSFTELFYESPANKGNPELKPETSFTIEAGLDYFFSSKDYFETTIFFRGDSNIIDWVMEGSVGPWQAKNIRKIDVWGLETSMRFRRTTLGYTYLHSTSSIPAHIQSKYMMNHPIHQFTWLSQGSLPLGLRAGFSAVYKLRKGRSGYTVFDCKLTKSFNNWSCFLQAANLFNTGYEEIPGVRMPGRWLMTGIKFSH